MLLSRLLSILLCTALVACPCVCPSGACTACPKGEAKISACSHCGGLAQSQANGERSHGQPPARTPVAPKKPCQVGNCLCAGALTNQGGLELQIGHVLDLFKAVEASNTATTLLAMSALEPLPAGDEVNLHLSGHALRLRIESLLI
jgi:hypothetical protein